jgi:phage terminase large subunit GpA-like protein
LHLTSEFTPGVRRNEALDLSVYNLALGLVLGVEGINWQSPAAPWAVEGPANSFAIVSAPDVEGEAAPAEPVASKPRPRRRPASRKRFDGWG